MAETGSCEVGVAMTRKEKACEEKACEEKGSAGMDIIKKRMDYGGLLTIFSFILSLPILASSIWLLYMRDYNCEHLLGVTKIRVGISIGLIFVFLLSNGVAYVRSRLPILGMTIVMVPLMLMLVTGLTLVGAYRMENGAIPASPIWLKMEVYNQQNWKDIKSCLYHSRVCDDFVLRSLTLKSYTLGTKKMSLIESGCCNPPTICAMEYVNDTFWKKGVREVESSFPYEDCGLWDNDRKVLCYGCNTCKRGFKAHLQSKWWNLGTFLIIMSLLLTITHILLFVVTMWDRYMAQPN